MNDCLPSDAVASTADDEHIANVAATRHSSTLTRLRQVQIHCVC